MDVSFTQADLIDLMNYDSETGIFTWSKSRRGVIVGKPLGTSNGFGYLRITVLGQSVYAHRLAWMFVHGSMPECQIDHINGDRSDNRISNLRSVTCAQNLQNKIRPQSNSKSSVLGVSWHEKGKKWQSHIAKEGKRIYLGLFESIDDAKQAYLLAKREIHEFNTL